MLRIQYNNYYYACKVSKGWFTLHVDSKFLEQQMAVKMHLTPQ